MASGGVGSGKRKPLDKAATVMYATSAGKGHFWGHTFELMGCQKGWDGLEAAIAKISEDSQAQWIDVIDLFV